MLQLKASWLVALEKNGRERSLKNHLPISSNPQALGEAAESRKVGLGISDFLMQLLCAFPETERERREETANPAWVEFVHYSENIREENKSLSKFWVIPQINHELNSMFSNSMNYFSQNATYMSQSIYHYLAIYKIHQSLLIC